MGGVDYQARGAKGIQVMAIGDSGRKEACPAAEAVAIQALPAGPRNVVTPASIRFIFWRRAGNEARPVKIRSVLKPNTTRNRSPYVRVVFESTPFSRAELDSGHVWGDWMDVAVPALDDATDQLWDTLSARDRARITNAVRNAA
ncbi:hypothetical protein [Stenotrophomonas sp. BIGb0135]|uniref:hypothetical protein n=1 Tax=Stenotrophomonas sp. BIGb0135 TaxID=2940620 RepID=UPI002168FFF5|nr:hypothetical protein [Stenotrophomonas sp. BIGb0135]MCS4235072.1 hypothetical protein [Stenotrophomonas sp. BIGb0135]MCS4235127.1 hypothetical protein [Stenotrophomonas sp. BIGb0135]